MTENNPAAFDRAICFSYVDLTAAPTFFRHRCIMWGSAGVSRQYNDLYAMVASKLIPSENALWFIYARAARHLHFCIFRRAMMNRVSIILVALGLQIFCANAQAKAVYLDLSVSGEGQRSRMDAGVEAVDSAFQNSSVRILEDENKVKKRGQFSISAFNATNSSINFGPENITIAFGAGQPVAMVSYERLVKEEKNRQMWAAIGAGLSAAGNNMAASQAGYSSGAASYSGSTYGQYGTSNFSGTANYSGYNGAAAYAAQANANAQNGAMFDRLAATNAANLQALKANMRTTTIDPGMAFGGLVTFELPPEARKLKSPVAVRIIVEFAGDRHEFSGQLVQK